MARKIGGPGKDTLIGEDEDDVLRGRGGNDTILGNGGADRLHGGGGRDNIAGGDGDDRILGQGGADRLGGGAGGDIIRGGGGADVLFGDAGNNQLIGGKGKDMFALSPDLPGNSAVLDFNYDQGDRILLDVDVNGNGRLNATEYENYKLRMDQIEIQTSGNDSLVTLSATGVATAAEGDDGPILRLAGVPLRGALSELAVHDYGLNAGQEVQVPTNPSRSSNETEATVAPALNANGRFLAVVSQVNLDNAAEPPSDPEASDVLRDVFVYDLLTYGGLGDDVVDDVVRVNTSVASQLASADGTSDQPGDSVSISADGRFVAFSSNATNLAPSDSVSDFDVFVKDMLTGVVRHASDGIARGDATAPSLSADGRTVAYVSEGAAFASGPLGDLVPIDVGATVTGVTLAAGGQRAIIETETLVNETLVNGIFVAELRSSRPEVRFLDNGRNADLSADGRFVVYDDSASGQVLRREIDGGETLVIRSAEGGRGDASISEDGGFIAFRSAADNLVSDDTNGIPDIFVKDLEDGAIVRVSIDSRGQQAFGGLDSGEPTISSDGKFVAYTTDAPNLQDLFVNSPPDPVGESEDPLDNGRTVVWSPIDFDLVALPDVRGDEQTEALLSVGGRIEGDIAAFGDVDLVRVRFEANQLYEIAVTGDPANPSNVELPFLALKPQGESASLVDLTNGVFGHLATQDGIGFLALGSNPGLIDFSAPSTLEMFLGEYAITLQGIDDILDDLSSSATLAVGDPVRQAIEQPGDRDWFGIELEAGQSCRFEMRGASSDNGSLSNPKLELYDAGGALQVVGQDDVLPGSDLDSLLEFTAPVNGTYFVSAAAGDAATGTYTLSATQIVSPVLSPLAALVDAQPADLPPTG